MILAECAEDEDAVCYVTFDDADALDIAIKALEQDPSVTRPHAQWIVIDEGSEGDEAFCHHWATLKCSRCGFERDVEDDYVPDYCEVCGAKMDEDERTLKMETNRRYTPDELGL